jgi:hypothetical protein
VRAQFGLSTANTHFAPGPVVVSITLLPVRMRLGPELYL